MRAVSLFDRLFGRKERILIRTLLTDGSRRQILRYEKDPKKRKKARGRDAGRILLYVMMAIYAGAAGVGLGALGMSEAVPGMCAMSVCALEFIFGIFQNGSYLYSSRDEAMLMTLPVRDSEIVGAKLGVLYLHNLPRNLSLGLPMLVGYGIFARPNPLIWLLWIILLLVLPVIPMTAAALIGALIVRIGSRMRHKSLVQSILLFIFILFCFSLRFIITYFFRDGRAEQTIETVSGSSAAAGRYYLPIAWFSGAICDAKVWMALVLIAVSALIYIGGRAWIGHFWRRAHTAMQAVGRRSGRVLQAGNAFQAGNALQAGNVRQAGRASGIRQRSPVRSVAYKELRRFLGSSTYLTQMGMGQLLTVILSVAVLFVPIDSIISVVTSGAPVPKQILLPATPLIIYFLTGMVSTTAVSMSLEGKNRWILQSLPVRVEDVVKGKMLFQLWISIPFMLLGCICLGIALGAGPLELLLSILCGICLCLFSTAYGMVCGIRHVQYEWEQEIDVIKRGSAVALYMLPNMFVCMGLVVGVIILSLKTGLLPVLAGTAGLAVLLTAFCCLALYKSRPVI